jgi:protein involved in polysaccharide export with SLBB domain
MPKGGNTSSRRRNTPTSSTATRGSTRESWPGPASSGTSSSTPKDKLSILVNSQDLRLTNLFNLPIVSQQIGMETPSGMSRGLSGYTVDSKGNIDFPVLGAIHIEGMTREEVATHIKKELQSHDLIKEPVVTVEFMNLTVSVMGEVNKPGRYNIEKDHVTILDASCVNRLAVNIKNGAPGGCPTSSL